MVAVISISALFTVLFGMLGIDVTGVPAVLFLGAALPGFALLSSLQDPDYAEANSQAEG